jgi:dTDP-4-amino-4,6-dideoxygalactose transaminase
MTGRIYLSSPHMSDEGYEMQYIKEAFDTNWIAPLGPNVDEFEKEFAAKVGAKHAAALSSGTAAIHMALKAAGVGEGDIVFCQSLTFSATANPIIYQGAIPVFIDSDYETWNMDPNALEEAFKKHPDVKAVIVVHLYGLSADMDRIMDICNKHNAIVIEDAAESLGTYYNGKHTGTFGDYGVFSFNGNKIITTSGGGILVSNNEEKIEKVRFWATQARDKARHYQHSELGYNYRMSNIVAGIGRGQLKVLVQRIAKKRHIFDFYKREFSELDGVEFMPINEWNEPNCWLTCITLSNENHSGSSHCHSERSEESYGGRIYMRGNHGDGSRGMRSSHENCPRGCPTPLSIMQALEKENIESRPIWKPMHMQPFFEKYDYIGGEASKKLFENGVCLPSDTKMTDEDLHRISEIIKGLF